MEIETLTEAELEQVSGGGVIHNPPPEPGYIPNG